MIIREKLHLLSNSLAPDALILTESEFKLKLADVRKFGEETDKPRDDTLGGVFSIQREKFELVNIKLKFP